MLVNILRHLKRFLLAARLFAWNKVFAHIPIAWLRLWFSRHYIFIGKNGNVLTNVEILYSGLSKNQISIGENTVINSRGLLDGRHSKIAIGKNVDIGREVAIFTLEHDPHSDRHAVRSGEVVIEDYVWIAARATILPGVTLKRGSVIAACSVVTKDVEENTIVAGNPAKVIGKRQSKLNYETKFFPYLR